MSGASEALGAATRVRLKRVGGLTGVHEGKPVQAAHPYAVIEAGPETDWSHKTGAGRDIRLAVLIHDRGERPERLRRLIAAVESEVAAVPSALPGWHVVTLGFVRSRLVLEAGGGRIGLVEFRARLLAAPGP